MHLTSVCASNAFFVTVLKKALVTRFEGNSEDHPTSPYASRLFSGPRRPSARNRVIRKQCGDVLYPVISYPGIDAVVTSDQEERLLLTQQSRQDYWFGAFYTPGAPAESLHFYNSPAAATVPPDPLFTPTSSSAVIASIGSSDNESDLSETSFRQRVLRPRKQIQLNPYTVENASYRAILKLRGQKDAIVRLKDIKSGHQFDEYNVDESTRQCTPLAAANTDHGSLGTFHPGLSLMAEQIPAGQSRSKRRRRSDPNAHTEDAGGGYYFASPSSPPEVVIKRLQRQQARWNQNVRPRIDHNGTSVTHGVDGTAARGAGRVQRTANSRRAPITVIGDPDSSDCDVDYASGLDRTLSGQLSRSISRSSAVPTYGTSTTMHQAVMQVMQGRRDVADSSDQPDVPPAGFKAGIASTKYTSRTLRNRHKHVTNICIPDGPTDNCPTEINHVMEPMSATVRSIFVVYTTRLLITIG